MYLLTCSRNRTTLSSDTQPSIDRIAGLCGYPPRGSGPCARSGRNWKRKSALDEELKSAVTCWETNPEALAGVISLPPIGELNCGQRGSVQPGDTPPPAPRVPGH